MAAMFAGASRAYLTSITFALEATMQSLITSFVRRLHGFLFGFFFSDGKYDHD